MNRRTCGYNGLFFDAAGPVTIIIL